MLRLFRVGLILSIAWLQAVEPAVLLAATGCPAPGLPSAVAFPKEALALGVAAMHRSSGALRRFVIERYREALAGIGRQNPQPASGSGQGGVGGAHSIDQAVAKARQFIDRGQRAEAYVLLGELAQDLRATLQAPESSTLLAKWYARFPSDVPAISTDFQLENWIGEVDRLLEGLALDPEEENDARFFAMMRRGIGLLLDEARAAGYDLPTDLLGAYRAARRMRNTFPIHLPLVVQRMLEAGSPVDLVVREIPTVGRIAQELETQYPALVGLRWVLKVDGRNPASPMQIVLPGQELELVLRQRPNPRLPAVAITFLLGANLSLWETVAVSARALAFSQWTLPDFTLKKTDKPRRAALSCSA
jgi:hypothetical protein